MHLQRKILVKIKLGVICAHMVDLCRPGHNCGMHLANYKYDSYLLAIRIIDVS